jgi:hypothetical protein
MHNSSEALGIYLIFALLLLIALYYAKVYRSFYEDDLFPTKKQIDYLEMIYKSRALTLFGVFLFIVVCRLPVFDRLDIGPQRRELADFTRADPPLFTS